MSRHETTESDASSTGSSTDQSSSQRIVAVVRRLASNGTLAMLAGGLLLGRAVRALRGHRIRATFQALSGVALLAIGVRQRRSATTPATGSVPTTPEPASQRATTGKPTPAIRHRDTDAGTESHSGTESIPTEPEETTDTGQAETDAETDRTGTDEHTQDDSESQTRGEKNADGGS